MMTDKIDKEQREELQLKINQYSDMLFKICFLRLQNRQDAEDAVQDVLYQYIRREVSFESGEHEQAWLITVALNACRKLRRSTWYRHRSQQLAGEESGGGLDTAATVNAEVLPESAVLRREANRILLEAVMKLPLKYRDVIHLFYYEQLSVKQIARITGRKESTVTSQLARGRELPSYHTNVESVLRQKKPDSELLGMKFETENIMVMKDFSRLVVRLQDGERIFILCQRDNRKYKQYASSTTYMGESVNERDFINGQGLAYVVFDTMEEGVITATHAVISVNGRDLCMDFYGFGQETVENVLKQLDLSIYFQD